MTSDSKMTSFSTTTIPDRIITSKADKRFISEILPFYDPTNYENATTKYRKPFYQRMLSKPKPWCIALVDSILRGFSTGALTLSKWITYKIGEDGIGFLDEFYNVEDGQTRLDAYIRFQNGEFESTYGPYIDPEIKKSFDSATHAVIVQEKINSRISDSDYYAALMENFSLLQEGTPLTDSDRYWAWESNSSQDFVGSPIVNYCIELWTTSQGIKHIFGLHTSSNGRKQFSNVIGLVSGCLYGPKKANSKYFDHSDILHAVITDDDKTVCLKKLGFIFSIINKVESSQPKFPREQFTTLFRTSSKFIGSIIYDLHEGDVNRLEDWVKFIVAHRQKKENCVLDWANRVPYSMLSRGDKTNNKVGNFIARSKAVHNWANID